VNGKLEHSIYMVMYETCLRLEVITFVPYCVFSGYWRCPFVIAPGGSF